MRAEQPIDFFPRHAIGEQRPLQVDRGRALQGARAGEALLVEEIGDLGGAPTGKGIAAIGDDGGEDRVGDGAAIQAPSMKSRSAGVPSGAGAGRSGDSGSSSCSAQADLAWLRVMSIRSQGTLPSATARRSSAISPSY